LKAIPAIYWFFTAGLERNLGLSATLRTNRSIHLAFAIPAVPLLPGRTAGRTTTRLVLKTFGGIKLLLASGKDELLTAFFAN